MDKDTFYKMLAEIHTAVADTSCGCMGKDYTAQRMREEEQEEEDYIGKIIRKYIKSEV